MGRRDGELWGQSRLKYGDVFGISLRKGLMAEWLWPKARGNRPESRTYSRVRPDGPYSTGCRATACRQGS